MKRNNQLSNFTNVIDDDDLGDSQPLSLLSSNNIEVTSIDSQNGIAINLEKPKRPERGTGQKGHLRSIQEIDEKYRDVFQHPYFNLVQSRIIDDALYTDKSLVICAPTGSGKTLIFEMAIVQLLMDIEEKNLHQDFKIIYMAPVKSLCTERLTEWYPKFTKFGLLCIEVTGDTDVDFPQLKPYRIIITTPEKWDMLTRRWKDHTNLVEVIKLFLIDEVHILNDEARGPVLEAVVSRMKTIESSAKSAHRIGKLQRQYQNIVDTIESPAPKIRFIAVSATVSNPDDVASWLGTPEQPAVFYKFGEECRPVKLNLVVEGYPCAEGSSIFKFDIVLNYKLWPIIQKYHNGKPTLIFCNTRKSVALTAETLSREITVGFTNDQRARLAALASTIKTKKIQSLILCGVGCHHAGLLYEERVNIENAFRNKDLPILITTTTLAMGVNLPAHLVIIKNTQQYMNGGYQEYSISTILQMVGRAGRPQYDTEATAVIMTRMVDKARYQSLVGGSEPLQSYLHKRLAENLNSEASLGTVTDVAQCVEWVNSTFLSVRAVRDPRRYLGLPQNASKQLITKKIEELCVKAMNGLATSGLITMDEASCIQSTDAGRLMSVYYIDVQTMKTIMKIEGTETLEKLLWLLCESHELSDMHLRVDERRSLNALNRNNAAATIRFPMKGKINSRQMKLNCIIQAVLGCLPIPDPSLNQEAFKIMRIADRVCKCLVAYVTSAKVMAENPKCFSTVLNAVILAKCLSANIWEISPYLSKQLKGIGPTFSSLLASAGKTTFTLLEESHPRDLERIMNKSAPAGNDLRKQISFLPKYRLTMVPIDQKSVRIELVILNQVYLMENMERLTAGPNHKFYLIVGDSENNLLYYSVFKDKDFLSVYDGCITCDITRKQDNEHRLMAHCISSTFVGIDDNSEYTFKDLNPCIDINKSICTPRETILKQTNITDTFTRKRKSPKQESQVSKKKRDTGVIKQFKNLRESLGITSKSTKDFNKTISTNIILNNVTPQVLEINESNSNDTTELSDTEEHIEDKIMNILNDIENNKENNNTVAQITEYKQDSKLDLSQIPNVKALPAINKHVSFNINKYKRKKPLNNLSVIESIEKKSCQNEPLVSESDAGFSSAIRDHLNKYIDNVQHKSTNNVDMPLLKSLSIEAPAESTNVEKTIGKNILKGDTSPQKSNSNQTTSETQLVQNEIATKYNNNEMYPQHNKTKGLAIPEPSMSLTNYKDNFNKVIPTNNDTQIKSYEDKHLEINPFLAIEYPNFDTIDLDNMYVKPAESNINSIGYNNFLLPIQPASIQTSQNRDISLHQDSIPVKNEINNYRILDIVEPKSVGILKNRDFNHSKDNVDVNQYFFSATKINSCTKVLPEREIHIVGRLKVDFNVMEIKTKSDNSNTDYSEFNTSDNDIITSENDIITSENDINTSENDINYPNIEVEGIPQTNLGITCCSNTLDSLPTMPRDTKNNKMSCIESAKINIGIEKNGIPRNTDDTENPKQNKAIDVKDILHKYQRKLHVSKITPSQSLESTNEPASSQNIIPEKDFKPKRQYKIRDFDKINIPLPEALASVITEAKISSQACKINNIATNNNETVIKPLDIEEKNNEIYLTPETEPFKYTIDDDLADSPVVPDIDIEKDYDLSQAMLNPKALLRAANDQIIVPPPPEFSDTYSPTYDKTDFINNFNDYYDFEPENAVSEEVIDNEPNAEGPKEEWTLSREDISYTPYESTSQNLSLSETLSQRKIKLNKFKFKKNNNYTFKK